MTLSSSPAAPNIPQNPVFPDPSPLFKIPANGLKHTGKSVIKQRAGRAGWTLARRGAQSARLRAALLWRRSTGPRTIPGKNIARFNALKHGMRHAAERELIKKIRAALRAQRMFLKIVKLAIKIQNTARLSSPVSFPACAGMTGKERNMARPCHSEARRAEESSFDDGRSFATAQDDILTESVSA